MNEFKVGDVVVLKSGGPKMVISVIDPIDCLHYPPRAGCTWLTPAGKPMATRFKLVCLRYPTAQDEWREQNRLPTYPAHRPVCQDCRMNPAHPVFYGLQRFQRSGPGGGVEVVDWMNLCDPCLQARGLGARAPEADLPGGRMMRIARTACLIDRKRWRQELGVHAKECEQSVSPWFEDDLRAFLDRLDAC